MIGKSFFASLFHIKKTGILITKMTHDVLSLLLIFSCNAGSSAKFYHLLQKRKYREKKLQRKKG